MRTRKLAACRGTMARPSGARVARPQERQLAACDVLAALFALHARSVTMRQTGDEGQRGEARKALRALAADAKDVIVRRLVAQRAKEAGDGGFGSAAALEAIAAAMLGVQSLAMQLAPISAVRVINAAAAVAPTAR